MQTRIDLFRNVFNTYESDHVYTLKRYKNRKLYSFEFNGYIALMDLIYFIAFKKTFNIYSKLGEKQVEITNEILKKVYFRIFFSYTNVTNEELIKRISSDLKTIHDLNLVRNKCFDEMRDNYMFTGKGVTNIEKNPDIPILVAGVMNNV